jgi:histidinol-phosphate aminotransferase
VTDWSSIVVPALRDLPPFDVAATVSEVRALDEHEQVAKLNWNENPFGPLPGVLEAVEAALDQAWLYPVAPYEDFRAEVARFVDTHASRIVPGHGTQALIGTVANAFLLPGDTVVVPELTFGLYGLVSAARGAVVHRVPMHSDLRIDLAALASKASEVEARLVWVCDPNNPTGMTVGRDDWDAFLAGLPERCIAVADEAYVDFLPPERRAARELDVADGRPVVVLRSFSKFFGLAGLRLGYAIADEALVAHLTVVDEPFNVNCLALAAGRASLRATEAADRRRREVVEARAVLVEGLRAAGTEPHPSEANFVLTRVDVDDMLLAEELARCGILVRPGAEFGLPRHLRITVGPTSLMERVTSELRTACAAVGS